MKLALELNMPVNGIKGPSPLINLNLFNPVLSQAVDYMHCVLLGVTRQLTEFWLDSANCQEPFYIGAPSTIAKLDKRLLSICPPHCFTRLPRSLADRCFWKASEWKNWLLYYSLPTVLGVLPPRFWRHMSMLAEAIFTLLKSAISPTDLQCADGSGAKQTNGNRNSLLSSQHHRDMCFRTAATQLLSSSKTRVKQTPEHAFVK
ncbi:uncharacterized protein [Dermacentor albipictus]|uniref:uncharacterized protein n=1 Tax=Dermacentor albipictus TaxID=60249 RepID=UPI0038FCBB9E